MMRLRTLGSALAAVAFATVFAVAVPSAATAAEYPVLPQPVEFLPDTPSEWATLTPEEAAYRKAVIGGMDGGKSSIFSRMSPLARGNTVLLAGGLGFTLGAGGMKLIMSSEGTWDSSMCGLPTIVRDGYTLLSLGVGSADCSAVMPTPNVDIPAGYSISYGGASVSFVGISANGLAYCYSGSDLLPTGFSWGWWNKGTIWRYGVSLPGGSACPQRYVYMNSIDSAGSLVVVTSGSSGTSGVVASMAETRADPEREYRLSSTPGASGGGGGSCSTIVRARDSAGLPLGRWAEICGPELGLKEGKAPGSVKVEEYDPNAGTWNPVAEAAIPLRQQQNVEEYPECYNGSQTCALTLQSVAGTSVNNCFTGDPTVCRDWWTQTQQGTVPTTLEGTRFDCNYGPYTVSLERCAIYQKTFTETGTQTGVVTDPTGSPTTSTQGSTSTSPNTINPGAPVGTPAGNCMASWFDDPNPIDWVLTPVKCALVWAFVPRQTVVDTALNGVTTAWDAKPPGQIIAAVEGWAPTLDAAGCSITVEIFSGEFRNPITPVDACEGSWVSSVTPISRLVVNVGMIVMIVVVLKRQIAGMVNYGPGQ